VSKIRTLENKGDENQLEYLQNIQIKSCGQNKGTKKDELGNLFTKNLTK